MKTLCLFCGAIALIACFNLPIWYFTFLRITITIGSIAILIKEVQNDVNLLGIAFVVITVLFNPIIPIHFHQKTLWMPIDILTGILFLVYGIKVSKKLILST